MIKIPIVRPIFAIVWASIVQPAAADINAITHPEEKFAPACTVVWTPLFQASWDALNKYHGGKPLKIDPPNALIDKLNAFHWEKAKVMPEKGWKTWAGPATPDFLGKVNAEAAAITGEAKGPFTLANENPPPDTVAVFGLLDRTLNFQKPFYRSKKVPLDFKSAVPAGPGGGGGADGPATTTKVHFFGIRGYESIDFAATVKVLAYRPRESTYALEIACSDPGESIILYRPPNPEPQDFATACDWLRTWRKQWKPDESLNFDDSSLHSYDEVKIPYLKLESTVEFKDRLASMRFYKEQALPRLLSRAEQKVKFELHERGAKVRGEVSMEDPFGGTPEAYPRLFHYNAPFFVFLWRKDAEWPYYGTWVGDASAMEKWE